MRLRVAPVWRSALVAQPFDQPQRFKENVAQARHVINFAGDVAHHQDRAQPAQLPPRPLELLRGRSADKRSANMCDPRGCLSGIMGVIR